MWQRITHSMHVSHIGPKSDITWLSRRQTLTTWSSQLAHKYALRTRGRVLIHLAKVYTISSTGTKLPQGIEGVVGLCACRTACHGSSSLVRLSYFLENTTLVKNVRPLSHTVHLDISTRVTRYGLECYHVYIIHVFTASSWWNHKEVQV